MKLMTAFCIALIALCIVYSAVAGGYVPIEIPCPRNEVWLNCSSPCQTTCANLGKKCTIVNVRCPDGCYCVEGYARNSCGKCIPIEKCFLQ